MTELQEKELDILKEFIKICDKLNLKYFLVCGSALGAVKYGGFIPWDDDVDVALLRKDYEVFVKKAPDMLPEYLFLQNYLTDPKYPQLFSKIRNSKTTYIEKTAAHLSINHGIYIDVFPLDGYPLRLEDQKKLEKKKKRYKQKLYCSYNIKGNYKDNVIAFLGRLLGYHKKTQHTLEQYTHDISMFDTDSADLLCNHGNWQGQKEYAPAAQYGIGAWAEFEGIRVRVPERYDEYLTQKYGDWRAELPEKEQKGHHFYVFMDTKNPYTKYMKRG